MKTYAIPALVLALGLSACVNSAPTSRMMTPLQNQVSSDASQVALLPQQPAVAAGKVLHAQYDVQVVTVLVPRSLKSSEANTYLPNADIVWRGDAPGDRHAQIKAIIEQAATIGTATMHSGPKVVVELEVLRFHCLTEKTRYTVGGVHSMHLMLTVRSAETGAILQGPRSIIADVKASGGSRAIAEEQAGRTQKVVVTERLVEVIRRELSAPVTTLPADALVTRFDGSPIALAGRPRANAGLN